MSLNCAKVPDLSCKFGIMLRCGSTRLIFSGLHSTTPSQLPTVLPRPKEKHICVSDVQADNPQLVFPSSGCKHGIFSHSALPPAHLQSVFPNVDFFHHAQQARIQGLKNNKHQRAANVDMLSAWSKTHTPLLANHNLAVLSLHNDKALYIWEKVLAPEKRNGRKMGNFKAKKTGLEKTIAEHSTGNGSPFRLPDIKHHGYETNCSKDSLIFTRKSPTDNGVCMFKGTDKDSSAPNDKGKGKGKPKQPKDKATPLQLSHVLYILREELPWFFFGGHKFDIYNKKVVFINGMMSNLKTRGLLLYRIQMNLMRWTAMLCYSQVTLSIIGITKDDKESVVTVRWQVEGTARYKAYAKWLTVNVFPERKSFIDGISTLEVGSDGNVAVHTMEKVMRMKNEEMDPKFVVQAASFFPVQ